MRLSRLARSAQRNEGSTVDSYPLFPAKEAITDGHSRAGKAVGGAVPVFLMCWVVGGELWDGGTGQKRAGERGWGWLRMLELGV
jgi:hypothetical protein